MDSNEILHAPIIGGRVCTRTADHSLHVTKIAEPPLEPTVCRADAACLERIAEELRRRTGITTTVLP